MRSRHCSEGEMVTEARTCVIAGSSRFWRYFSEELSMESEYALSKTALRNERRHFLSGERRTQVFAVLKGQERISYTNKQTEN